MPNETLIKLALGAVMSLVLAIFLYMGYNHIKDIGYKEAEIVYTAQITKLQKDIGDKVDNVEKLASTIADTNKTSSDALATDVAAILARTKGKSLVVVKDGGCVPSQTFIDSISEVTKRTNQAIKDSQK